ncbi:MAG: hypothetical protein K2G23_09020, partial [Muribaculaceae bacterium]|nr:hypothetical protein [Muribaculaceae bacterium]
AADAEEIEWAPMEEMEASGMKKLGNEFTFNVDGDDHFAGIYLYKGEMVNMTNLIRIDFSVEKNSETGINGIEAADSDARYFNLQGVEVKNPESGVYVKVSNGKVSKVTVK